MSYNPITDFIALLRSTGGGVRSERTPGLDFVVAAMSRAGLFTISVSYVAPIVNQNSTVWVLPASPSYVAECAVFLWNAATFEYEPATPALWSALLMPPSSGIVQDVAVIGPVNVAANARVVRVMNVGAPVTLVMPPAVNKIGDVLISDWANLAGANNITIQRSGGDVFPNGAASWTLAADSASLRFAPVPGGYAL